MSSKNCRTFQLITVLLILTLCSPEKSLHRQKRFLYFPFGGTFKVTFGFAVPVKLGLKQSMGWGWNLQLQYPQARTTNDTKIYPPIVSRSREKRDGSKSDRALAYEGFETVLSRNGLNGRECLLRSICENAMESLHHEANGLYGHLLHIALTPDYGDGRVEPDLDPVYMDAKRAGVFGVDCASLYPECQEHGLLDMISLLDE